MPAAVTCNLAGRGPLVAAVMIGAGPHKGPHTAAAIGAAEETLGQVRVRASAAQAERLAQFAIRPGGHREGQDVTVGV